jgi:hypothetical protein
MIYTAYYYSGSLEKGDLIVRDNRFYPGKYFETFPVWLQYVRKHYPNEHIVIFADAASPIPIEHGLQYIEESYEFFYDFNIRSDIKVHIKILREHSNKYFWAMQRNLVEAISMAYELKDNMFWLDNDAFLNSEILSIAKDYDVLAPQINHQQFTCDSVCTYISAKRLREMDWLFKLPDYLKNMLANGPTETRMHSLQEGGLYKTFCYGNCISYTNLNLSHLSCYQNFMKFLVRNPLDTAEWHMLYETLETFDFSKIPNVELKFHDMYYEKI